MVDGTYQRVLMRSTDGKTWSMTPTVTRRALDDGGVMLAAGTVAGAVGLSASGAMETVNGGCNGWYEKQQFYRSTDHGLTWGVLPSGAFFGSHPAGGIAWGLVNRTEPACSVNS